MAEPKTCALTYYSELNKKARKQFSTFIHNHTRLKKKCYKFTVSFHRSPTPDNVTHNNGIIQILLNFKKTPVPLIITPANTRTKRKLIKERILDENVFSKSSKIFKENKLVKFRLVQDDFVIGWYILDEWIQDQYFGINFNKEVIIEISSYVNADAINWRELLPAKDTSEEKTIKEEKIRYTRHYEQNVGANLTDYRNKIQTVRKTNYESFDFTIRPEVSYDKINEGELSGNKSNTMFAKKAYENMMDIKGTDARQELEKELCIGTTASPTPECMAVNGEAIGFPLTLGGAGNLGTVMETRANRTLSHDHNKRIRDYACKDWSKDNFKDWECVNCWICGLPLWWAGEGSKPGHKAPPEGEHKVQIGWMAAFGAGPITKLLMAKKNDEDDAEAVEGSQITTRSWSTTRKALLHDQRFLDWKRGVRGEGYAWSHRYCNREKSAYSTIKLTCDRDGNLKYYLNWEGIKYIAHRISRHRLEDEVGREKRKMKLFFPSYKPDMYNDRNKQFMAALKMLKQTAEEGTGFEGGKRTRYWNWGAEYMYNNMVRQLLPLVALLNKSFPDIGALNFTPQDKIRQGIRLNYKRLTKTFGVSRMQSGRNTLKTFFTNIMKTDDDSNKKRYEYLNRVFQFSGQNLRGGGKFDDDIKKLANGEDIKLKGKDMVELLPDLPNVGTFSFCKITIIANNQRLMTF